LFSALVELPAGAADTETRRQRLLALALEARAAGERDLPGPAAPVEPPTWLEVADGLDRLFWAWGDSEDRFRVAAGRVDLGPESWERWATLSDALNRIYAVDSTLKTLWKRLPFDLREDASVWSDDEAQRTIKHNRAIVSDFDPETSSGWEAWRERQRTGKPYHHWSGPLQAGLFHPDYFTGMRWVRGQMTYHAIAEPIELRQLRPGSEPRWKWKSAVAVSTEGGNERSFYELHLEGHDVVGQFGWLMSVFVDAQRMVGRLRRRAEARRAGRPR
jgi:hypothetical protein